MKQCNVPFLGREGWCYPMDSQWKKSCREAIPLLKGWSIELAEAFVKMCEALFSGHSFRILLSLVYIVSRSSERDKNDLHGNKTEELSITIKDPFVSFVLHNNGKLVFLGWHNGDSRCRDRELTLTTPSKVSWKTAILLCCMYDCDFPHIYIPLFWPDLVLKALCRASGLTWLWDLTSLKPSIAFWIIEERIWVLEESLKAKVRISVLATEIMKCIWLFQSDLHITFWMERSNAVYWQIVSF